MAQLVVGLDDVIIQNPRKNFETLSFDVFIAAILLVTEFDLKFRFFLDDGPFPSLPDDYAALLEPFKGLSNHADAHAELMSDFTFRWKNITIFIAAFFHFGSKETL
jgi:hypothetical protein